MHRFFFLAVSFCVLANAPEAQADKGTLKDTEFVIEKERKNLLEESPRLFDSAPTVPRTSEPPQLLPITPIVIQPVFDMLPRKIKLLRAKQDVVTQLYGNYLQAGHGNFYTPYLEGFLTNKRDPRYAYGVHFKHLSEGRRSYGEENHNLIDLHGKLFTKTLWLGGEVSYHRDSYPLYDSAKSVKKVQEKQVINHFCLHPTLASYEEGPINYQIEAFVHYLAASGQMQETQGIFQGRGDYALNDEYTLQTTADLYLTKYKGTNRHLFRINPALEFTVQDFDITGGLNLVYQSPTSEGIDSLHPYPILEANYNLYEWLRPYAGIKGDVQTNTLERFLQENPRLASDITLLPTNQRFLLYGGARGELIKQVGFHTGLSVGSYKNLHCFVNSATSPGQFDVLYDPATTLWNIFGELTHTNRSENWTTRLRGDYFYYFLQDLDQPWHRPVYQLDLVSTYQWHDKVVFKGSMCCLGGIKAQQETTKAVEKLSSVFDLGLGIDYLWNSRISIFLDCQNLLARRNKRYLNYPSRGFQFVAGLTYGW